MRVLPALAAMFLLPVAVAAQSGGGRLSVFGDYEAHYSVFNSSFLSPENAARYGVERTANRAVLSLSVRKNRDGRSLPVAARVRGVRSDLIHRHPLEFTEVRERDAVYYLAQFLFRHRDTLHFEITVQPQDGGPAHVFRFHQTLHRDGR